MRVFASVLAFSAVLAAGAAYAQQAPRRPSTDPGACAGHAEASATARRRRPPPLS